jgi:cathepsin L
VYRLKNQLAYFNALHPVRSDDPFDHYAVKHNKHYFSTEEKDMRRKIWAENTAFIAAHNANPNKLNKLAINHFGDLTAQERKELFGIQVTPDTEATYTHKVDPNIAIPASVDWRTKNAVTQVKDQGVCGSCWTFGSAAAFEGAYAIKTGQLVEFSEQQILDCAYIEGNQGCDGGLAYAAYTWLLTTKGLATEKEYPYRMQDSYCKLPKKGVQIKGYVNVTSGDEDALMNAVGTVGPVTVAINTMDPVWYYHTGSGIYDSDNCPGGIDDLDHQVTVVGYGTEGGIDYWIVKNSYSAFWGDKGFIKMRRNHNNLCGIATQPDYVKF